MSVECISSIEISHMVKEASNAKTTYAVKDSKININVDTTRANNSCYRLKLFRILTKI